MHLKQCVFLVWCKPGKQTTLTTVTTNLPLLMMMSNYQFIILAQFKTRIIKPNIKPHLTHHQTVIYLAQTKNRPSHWTCCLLLLGKLHPEAVPWQPGSLRPGNLPARDHKALLLDYYDPRPEPLDQQLQHLPEQNQEEVAPLQHLQLQELLWAGGAGPGPHLSQVCTNDCRPVSHPVISQLTASLFDNKKKNQLMNKLFLPGRTHPQS